MKRYRLKRMTCVTLALATQVLAACGGGDIADRSSTGSQAEMPVAQHSALIGEQHLMAPAAALQVDLDGVAAFTTEVAPSSPGPGADTVPVLLVSSASAPATLGPVAQPVGLWSLPERMVVNGDVTGRTITASNADRLAMPSAGIILDAARAPLENWTEARNRYLADREWTAWVDGRKRYIDSWIALRRERADLVAGYMHDYVDPITGAALKWSPETPEPLDVTTEQQVRHKQAWVFFVRSTNIGRTTEAARIYRATGDLRFADWAAQQLDFYAANYARWPLRTFNGRARMFGQGLDEASSVFSLLEAARLLAPYVAPARAEQWRTHLFAPMSDNFKALPWPMTAIGLWHGAATAAVAAHLGDKPLFDWAMNNPQGAHSILRAVLSSDFIWAEGSFTYNARVVSALRELVMTASLEGQGDAVADARTTLRRLLLAPLDYRFDDGSLPTPSDSSPMAAIDPSVFASVYRLLPTYWGLAQANSQRSWDALVDPPAQTPAAPPTLAVTTRNFTGVRMAVLRAGDWQAYVHYGQAMSNHAQQEALTYELHHGMRRISTDPGTTYYSSPYHGQYFTKGAAHNVPLIDGEGQATWSPGTVSSFVPEESRLTVAHSSYRPGVSVNRGFRATSQGFVERTSIEAGNATRRLGIAFHTDCTLAPVAGLTAAQLPIQPPATSATGYWQGMAAYRAGPNWSVSLTCGQHRYTYTVAGPSNQTVYIGEGPTLPLPAQRSVLYYETTGKYGNFESSIQAQ